jgi:hypothetical protein
MAKLFSKLFEEIEGDLSMGWDYLPITEKQKKFWSAGHSKFSITYEYKTKAIELTYYCLGHPSLESVLACVVCDSIAVQNKTFPEFCDEFGYNSDSMKALNMFKQCRKLKKKLSILLGDELFKEFMECDVDF